MVRVAVGLRLSNSWRRGNYGSGSTPKADYSKAVPLPPGDAKGATPELFGSW